MSKIKKILNIIFEKEEKIEPKPIANRYKRKDSFTPPTHTPKQKVAKVVKVDKDEYLTVTEIAKAFQISASELNNIFSQLKWAKKEARWWIATERGISLGAKQAYNTSSKVKYVKWNKKIKENFELIQAINGFRQMGKVKPTSNKVKGEEYETYIATYYKNKGYIVWEHGKEKGRLDQGIDLIVKKNKEIIFIQCKNWKENTRFKIDHVRVKASRAEARQFMLKNPLFKGYQNKFRYTLSSDCMHTSAVKYIEETNGLFDYEVIEMGVC